MTLSQRVFVVARLFAVASLGVSLVGCGAGQSARAGDSPQHTPVGPEDSGVIHQASPAEMAAANSKAPIAADKALLYVNGLGCPLCASNIDAVLNKVPGVMWSKVDLAQGTVQVALGGPQHPSPHALGEAVADAGFTLVKVDEK